MPTIMSHAAVAVALGPAFRRLQWPARVWWAGALCAVAPDADVAGFFLGVPLGSMLGHRGLTHSLAFAVALAAILAPVLVPSGTRLWLWLYLFLATASHGVLDAMTDGGIGIAFFAPFDAERYYLPWRPIAVSPLGLSRFLSARGAAVLASEARWVWLPSLVVAGAAWRLTRERRPRQASR
jgi:inner membrane protein